MQPELPKAYHQATLVDLLDRVLDKGLFLRADLVISVAGIPLIGATLSVALAGTETMLKYGLLADWDEAIRAERDPRRPLGDSAPPTMRAATRNATPAQAASASV